MTKIPDPTKILKEAGEIADDNIYSRQESESDRTSRHLADMQSDNQFAKTIRPAMAALVTLVWGALHVATLFTDSVTGEVLRSADAAFMTVAGFYFSARTFEKISKRKNAAAVKLETMKQRHERKMERRRERKRKRNADI